MKQKYFPQESKNVYNIVTTPPSYIHCYQLQYSFSQINLHSDFPVFDQFCKTEEKQVTILSSSTVVSVKCLEPAFPSHFHSEGQFQYIQKIQSWVNTLICTSSMFSLCVLQYQSSTKAKTNNKYSLLTGTPTGCSVIDVIFPQGEEISEVRFKYVERA